MDDSAIRDIAVHNIRFLAAFAEPAMSFITFNVELKYVGTQLRRIADALDQLIEPPAEAEALTPEDAVSYVDDEKIAQQELAEEAGLMGQWMRDHPEQVDEAEPDGGLGVFHS